LWLQGKGGFELCLEQHITPDVGFAMQQYYRWSGDNDWLKEIGYPIAKGIQSNLSATAVISQRTHRSHKQQQTN